MRKMSENSVNRGSINRTVGSEIKFAGSESKDKMYEPKHKRKIIRVLTVIAYVFSVSLAAIMLSLFYIFIYNPAKTTVENGRSQGTSEPVNLVVLSDVQKIANASINSTLEREEPKALPLEGLKLPFREKRGIGTLPLKKIFGDLEDEKSENTFKKIKQLIGLKITDLK